MLDVILWQSLAITMIQCDHVTYKSFPGMGLIKIGGDSEILKGTH